MTKYTYEAEAPSRETLHQMMYGEINRHKPNRLKTWTFWSGFLWGAVLIATMDYGDVHFCVGSCDDASAFRIGAQP